VPDILLASSLITAFTVSLLGSVHCLAMCGGFAAWCSGVGSRPFLAGVFYHLGRLVSYFCLGALAGVVGKTVDVAGAVYGITWLSGLLVGTFLLIAAVLALTPIQGLFSFVLSKVGFALPQGRLIQIGSKVPFTASLIVGLSSALLPCGWLYSFVAMAASTGTWWRGGLLMSAFWLGSVPILLMSGHMAGVFLRRCGASSRYIAIALIFATGLVSLAAHFFLAPSLSLSCHQ
jgi:sulfite exporter TauE/SafE